MYSAHLLSNLVYSLQSDLVSYRIEIKRPASIYEEQRRGKGGAKRQDLLLGQVGIMEESDNGQEMTFV
jgi:hypothetical protein